MQQLQHSYLFALMGCALVCLASIWPTVAWAQPDEEVAQATIRVEQLLDQAAQAKDDATIERYSRHALALARENNYDGGEARASLLVGQVCARTGRSEEALRLLLEAEDKAPTANIVLQASIAQALGDFFFQEKLYDSARRYYRTVLMLQPNTLTVLERTADAALAEMRFDTAEFYYKALAQRLPHEGNNAPLIRIYQKIANAYSEAGNAEKSLLYYHNIEKLIQESGTSAQRAVLYNNLGKQYVLVNNYTRALVYFKKAEDQCAYYPCPSFEVLMANIGLALHNTGDTKRGMEYLLRSLRLVVSQGNVPAQANLEHLIAAVYLKDNDLYNALRHNESSLELARKTKQLGTLTKAYKTGADISYALYDFERAIQLYQKHLTLLDSARREEEVNRRQLREQQANLSSNESQVKFVLARENFKDLALQQERLEKQKLSLRNEQLLLDAQRQEENVQLLQAQKQVNEARLREQSLLALQTRDKLRLAAQALQAEKTNKELTYLQFQQRISLADSVRRAQEVQMLRQQSELQQQADQDFRNYSYRLGALGLLILGILGISFVAAQRAGRRLARQNQKIEAQKTQIDAERHKSDELLRNILPDEVAAELKEQGSASPRFYASATVLFTDFVNFTSLSSNLSPAQLLAELDECFLAFDEICEAHQLEKIKTIGDAYMCAGGLPIANDTHPIDAVQAALEMMAWLRRRNELRTNIVLREMRIGIHTGPVVAGVVGKNKFAYDIWGDAVNVASRLETYSEPGRINISKETYEAVKGHYRTEYRGKQDVHNKGLVDMYFITN